MRRTGRKRDIIEQRARGESDMEGGLSDVVA